VSDPTASIPIPQDPTIRRGRRVPLVAVLALAVFCGALMALQVRVNSQLAARLGDGYTAAVISFASGLFILLVLVACFRHGRIGIRRAFAAVYRREMLWWYLFGGAGGAFLVLTQGLAAGVVGIALFTIVAVGGQTIGGLVFDRIGMGTGTRIPLTAPRVLGAILSLAAIAWSVVGGVEHNAPLWMLVLPFAAGVTMSWQQAVIGRVKSVADSALAATTISFAGGTVLLSLILVVKDVAFGLPTHLPAEPWLYLGGAIGCVFIGGIAILVRITGVLVLTLGTVAGQLLGALALGVLLPLSSDPIPFATFASTGLALVAVAVGSHQKRARNGSAS
jgi:transporter family-2 protein